MPRPGLCLGAVLVLASMGCGGRPLTEAAETPPADSPSDTAPPGPSLHLDVVRADASTVLAPVAALVTARDAAGNPWAGGVVIDAANPTASFALSVSEVGPVGPGQYRATVSSTHSGEATITTRARIDGHDLVATATVVFLPYLSEAWGVPLAVTSVNTPGPEDSIAISPDGKTLFFAYTPLAGCDSTPAGLGDPPDKAECRQPAHPIATPQRPCANGIGGDGRVTLGLFGDRGAWPWPKGIYDTYVAHRRSDGSFDAPDCVSFADDGVVEEVSPSSGPENPMPGRPYRLFFAYPDWLDIDPENGGSVFAVATVTAGTSTSLSDPITTPGHPPGHDLATSLTGAVNRLREDAEQIGELRVHYNPAARNYELYFSARRPGGSMDIVRSPLEGDYPVGDWGAAVEVPGQVNTDQADEVFPWLADLADGLHLFYCQGPPGTPRRVHDSVWEGDVWGAPTRVIEAVPTGEPGSVRAVALPAVSRGDFGVEMFFVYVLDDSGTLDLQIGVVRHL